MTLSGLLLSTNCHLDGRYQIHGGHFCIFGPIAPNTQGCFLFFFFSFAVSRQNHAEDTSASRPPLGWRERCPVSTMKRWGFGQVTSNASRLLHCFPPQTCSEPVTSSLPKNAPKRDREQPSFPQIMQILPQPRLPAISFSSTDRLFSFLRLPFSARSDLFLILYPPFGKSRSLDGAALFVKPPAGISTFLAKCGHVWLVHVQSFLRVTERALPQSESSIHLSQDGARSFELCGSLYPPETDPVTDRVPGDSCLQPCLKNHPGFPQNFSNGLAIMPFPDDTSTPFCNLPPPSSNPIPGQTMDPMSEARRPESVSVKRRKLQQRQQQDVQRHERLHEHKRTATVYANGTSDKKITHGNDTDDDDLYAERSDRESSVETPSERSVLTPDEPPENRATFGRRLSYETGIPPPLKIEIPEDEEVLRVEFDENRVVVPPSPRPVLQASLASWADFRYDRYSVVLDSPVQEAPSPELDTDDTFSPIETATPICFQQPKSRPSLISIVSVARQSKRRTKSMQSPQSQTVPLTLERPAKRQSTSSTHSAFPAAEATLFEIPDLPANALEVIANASQESLPLSTLSSRETTSKSFRKSSVPRLSTALSHARMSSIKNLIKTPTPLTQPRSFSQPPSHASRPSTSSMSEVEALPIKNLGFLGNQRNSTTMQRPSTAMSTTAFTSHSNGAMTALPCLPSPPADDSDSDAASAHGRAVQRKKSFSMLRRRSESIGQAIKGFGKITTKHDVPLPAGLLPISRKSSVLDLSSFSTSPLPSPLTGKSSVGAGSFTSNPMRSSNGGNIGLGLRSIDGMSPR